MEGDDDRPCGAQCHIGESRPRGETKAKARIHEEARDEGKEPKESFGLSSSRT